MEREKITGQVEISAEKSARLQKKIKNISQLGDEVSSFLDRNATEILGIILAGAIIINASDIHIEPGEKEAKLRMRVDGILHDVLLFDLKVYQLLISRIKLLAGLKINVSNRPQDGRFTILIKKKTSNQENDFPVIEIRTSILPAESGESVVMRTLNPENLIEVEDLGLRKDLTNVFEKEMKKPNGMIIVTGPTGSGKTTTLYAILKRINHPEIKIITIEDPIEYRLKGLSQTQVDQGKNYTFASGLKSIMRQDPDVILIGEIRDLETAEIACQAALTGHLVFSTLHTNDSAGAIARLIDLGVKPVSIAPSINMVVAQRLPRRICQRCATLVTPSSFEKEKIKKGLKGIDKNILPKNFSGNFKIPQIKGCSECNNTGYKGRVGIFETFSTDAEMEKLILSSPSISEIRDAAKKKGMVSMYQDGLIKVLEGLTTIEEIERLSKE
jgi:general secretion pathway protein E